MRFLFVDRIVESIPKQVIRGIKHVTQDDYYLRFDEHQQLCFIPSLIGETLGQLAAWNVMDCCEFTQRPVAGIVASARLHRSVLVGETIFLESFIDQLDNTAVEYHSVARVGSEIVFEIDGALGPLLPMDDFIDREVVLAQFAELLRPSDELVNFNSNNLPWILPRPDSVTRVAPMLFDRILSSDPGVSLCAEKRITRAAAYFADHFPKKPVLPLTVLLECKLNLAKEFIARAGFQHAYRISQMHKIKMNGFVSPGDVLKCTVSIKKCTSEMLILRFQSEVEGRRVCVVDMVGFANE